MMDPDDLAVFAEQCRYLLRAARLVEDTVARCEGVIPKDVAALDRLSMTERDLLDAFAIRFARCQDMLGGTLRACAALLGIRFVTHQQLLDDLRRRGFALSKSDWMIQRDLRNDVGHKYLGTDEQFVEFYQQIHRSAPALVETACRIRDFAVEKLGVDPSALAEN